ncbi:hemolymph clottable protein isoform X2 [Hyalella azteca]|uniref:Hemolymph clottable protein isoform X2 n=1 Tax=Hyalella azteca TaxID=294128 RepID=A0A979FU70_HYAAZ|nr:hemolymph clottable protein isoform X2 [Hyalella azteca]
MVSIRQCCRRAAALRPARQLAMNLLLIMTVLLAAGTTSGLQYPLSYQYRYHATVGTALPDAGPQPSLVSIDTILEVDTAPNNVFLIRFRDTRVGESHGSGECGQLGTEQQGQLAPALRELFEAPFQVTLDYHNKPQLAVPPDEPLWLSNVRKGVVQLLLVLPTVEHQLKRSYTNTRTNSLDSDTSRSPLQPTSFSRREDTIYGACTVQYVLSPASGAVRAAHPLPGRDLQRRAGKSADGSWPEISEYLYELQRSTDLNDCTNRPLMFTSTNTAGGKNHTSSSGDRFFTQSSLGRLILRGENNPRRAQNLRLEWAQVDAGAVMKPLGIPGAVMQIVTNQTLALTMTYKRRVPPPPSSLKTLNSMAFEMSSPFPQSPSQPSSWVRYSSIDDALAPTYPEEYLTGRRPNASATHLLKERLLQEVVATATTLRTLLVAQHSGAGKAHGEAPSGGALSGGPQSGGALSGGPQSGGSAAGQVIDQLVSITELTRALTKEDLADVSKKVLAMEDDLVKQVFREALSSSGASAAVAVVLDELLQRRPSPLDAWATLASVATSTRSPVSATQLHDPSNPPWQKVALVQALGYLQGEAAFEELLEIIVSSSSDVALRTAAVLSVVSGHTTPALRSKVFDGLAPLVASQVEPPALRQAAVLAMLTWRPDQTWWLRLARATWREESPAVAEFVAQAMRSVAELGAPAWRTQRRYAQEALALSRPVLAPSRQSLHSILEAFATPPMMELESELGWLLSLRTRLPDDFFVSLAAKMNAIRMPLLEAGFYGQGAELWRALRWRGAGEASDRSGAKLRREFNEILRGLGAATTPQSSPWGLLLLRLFSGLHAPLPLDAAFLQDLKPPGSGGSSHTSRDVHFFKFGQPAWREVVVPTDVGIPVVGHIRTPGFLYQKGKYDVRSVTEGPPRHPTKHTTVAFTGNTSFAWSLESSLGALVPWLDQTLETGVQLRSSIALINSSVAATFSAGTTNSQLQLNVSADVNKEVPVWRWSVWPYSLVRPLSPGTGMARVSYRHGGQLTPHTPLRKWRWWLGQLVGVGAHVSVEADNDIPRALPNSLWQHIIPAHDAASPSMRYQQHTLHLDTSGNHTSSAMLSLTFEEAETSHKQNDSARREFPDFELYDSKDNRSRKLSSLTGAGGFMVTARGNFSSGVHDIVYEASLAASAPNTTEDSQETQSYHLTFLRSGVPSDVPRPPKVCLKCSVTSPALPSLDRLDKLLQDQLHATVSATLGVGSTCRASKKTEVAALKAQLSVSPKQLRLLARRLPTQCNFDRLDPTTSLRRAAFYDVLHADLSWQQDVPGVLLNQSHAAASVLRSLSLPYTSSNCISVDAPQRRVLVNLTRSQTTRRATGLISRPGCLDYVEELPVPTILDLLLPLHGHHSKGHDGELHSTQPAVVPPSDQCYVLSNRVVTFDMVSYEMEPSTCDRVIFEHVGANSGVLVSFRGSDESPHAPLSYRVLMPAAGVDIRVEGHSVLINNATMAGNTKDVVDASGSVVASVSRTSDTVEVLLPSLLQALIRNSNALVLRVLDSALFRGAVGGLCGNFDGVALGDLQDPRGCLFLRHQGKTMAASWTVQPCSLPSEVVDKLKRQQWTCPRTPAELGQPATEDYDPERCSDEAHRVVAQPGHVCLTTVPVSACAPDCAPLSGTLREAMFEVKCWAETRLPESLKKAQKEGRLSYLEDSPGTLMPVLLSFPMECVPKRESRHR